MKLVEIIFQKIITGLQFSFKILIIPEIKRQIMRLILFDA